MRSHKEDVTMVKKILRPVLIGTSVGALGCTAILLLLSAVMAAVDVPKMAITPMAVMAAAVGAFISGIVCARIAREKGLLFGAAAGLVLYLLVLFVSLIVLHNIQAVFAFVKLLIMVGCGAVGGVVGVNFRKR